MTTPLNKRNWKALLWRPVRTLLVAYAALVAIVYLAQRRMQYIPATSDPPLPASLRGAEEFTATTTDGVRIKGWFWPGSKPATLVVFHGNAGHRGHRDGWLYLLRDATDASICIFDYRGYGGSEGSPTEAGLYRDGEAVLAWLRERGAPPPILVGESLGSGVAVELATRQTPLGVILQSPFTSCVDVAQATYFFLPVDWLMKDRYDNLAKIDDVKCPILLVHGRDDRIVPFRMSEQLHRQVTNRSELFDVEGAGHNDLLVKVDIDEYKKRWRSFVDRCTASNSEPAGQPDAADATSE